jgi:shikimate kinase/3-dehydroquinate synthase
MEAPFCYPCGKAGAPGRRATIHAMKRQFVERIFLTGLPGAGKTTTGRALAASLRWSFLDLDDLIVTRAGKSIATIFATEGEPRFRELESEALAGASARTRVVIATGGGVGETSANLIAMRDAGNTVCLDVSATTALARLTDEASGHDGSLPEMRPLLDSADPLARLSEMYTRRRPWYLAADLVVDANTSDPDALARRIVGAFAGAGSLPPDSATPVSRVIHTSNGAAYQAVVGWGTITTLGERLNQLGAPKRVHIVTDSQVAPLYQNGVEALLAQAGLAMETYVAPAGETSKTLAQWRAILDWLVERHAERGEFIVALGGGVIGDLAGFAAATYLRGIPLVHVPTSLLAQVDASIGGKVGVDLPQGKNLVGAFYPPRLVLSDPALLLTLPLRQFIEGWSEAVKVGVALDAAYFALLEEHADALLRREPAPLTEAIARAVALKAAMVEEDEGEHGARALLNYGHTIGHAIEQVTDYEQWLHGEAVAVGMAFAARLGRRIGVTPANVVERQEALLTRLGLPLRADGLSAVTILAALMRDKKVRSGQPRWVIPTALGASSLMNGADEAVRATLLEIGAVGAPSSKDRGTIGAADGK